MLSLPGTARRAGGVGTSAVALAAALGVLAAVAGPAAAARAGDGLRFGTATVVGADCTRNGPPAPVYDVPNKRFSVTFSGFEAIAERRGDIVNAACEVMVPVFLAPGFRLKVTDTIFAGKTTMGRLDTAHLLGEVRFHGLSRAPVYRVDKKFVDHAGILKTFAEKGDVQTDYNTCKETQVVVSIHTQIQSENYEGDETAIHLDSIEHTLRGAINLDLMTERC
ncbi:hypothetical protein GCM10010124_04260 [Pilimelia terevasa]|uniref:Uncharacterized protein n=1 Tax=Pilimelia terevasa TaxID=53372 RepID=A0A8J3BHK7_9ACTN|nr:hypothetical protein [Pilimelia terevasa]GGK14832.1 hypothetical protein GCM10010124_04260 [Pilimelia terevasa]